MTIDSFRCQHIGQRKPISNDALPFLFALTAERESFAVCASYLFRMQEWGFEVQRAKIA